MKVFRIVLDVNQFQSCFLCNPDLWSLHESTFDGRPRAAEWISPEVYVLKPKLKRGDFLAFEVGTMLFGERAWADLQDLFEMSGEILPVSCDGQHLRLINITECVNVLDQEKSQWRTYADGSRAGISRFAFHSTRFTETPLFKIPETCKGDMLTVEGMKHPDDEFKPRVEKLGLTGLIFEELWSDEL